MVTLTLTQQRLLTYMLDNRSRRITNEDIKKFYKNRVSAWRGIKHLKDNGFIGVKNGINKKEGNVYNLSIKGFGLALLIT